jgi:hypothetical protein
MGIKIHNSLPPELKRTDNFKVLKNKLKRYLLQNSIYSLQESFSNDDGRYFGWLGFDVVWMSIDGISVCVALYWIVAGCHPRLLNFRGRPRHSSGG